MSLPTNSPSLESASALAIVRILLPQTRIQLRIMGYFRIISVAFFQIQKCNGAQLEDAPQSARSNKSLEASNANIQR